MAFKDITKVLYDGKVKLDYKDKAHRYYARPRVNWDLPEDDPKAWGKIMYPKGTTTLIGDTLEKKGLMTWPMGLALRELFGYYNFKTAQGDVKEGFSKGVGSMWEDGVTFAFDQETLLPIVRSASQAWQRRQKQGADIGTVVHDAIEHFVLANPNREVPVLDKDGNPVIEQDGSPAMELPPIMPSGFDIAEQYNWNIKEAFPLPELGKEDQFEAERNLAFENAPADIEMANQAFAAFVEWWTTVRPVLYGAEDLLYSLQYNTCGTFDGDLGIPRDAHPCADLFPKKKHIIRVTADWKTSNASSSESAAMPEGVNYQYFVQSAIYELMRREMGLPEADDLLIVSARKDGGFSLVYASELNLTMEDCLEWAKAVILAYRLCDKTKQGLLAHAPKEQAKPKETPTFNGEAF